MSSSVAAAQPPLSASQRAVAIVGVGLAAAVAAVVLLAIPATLAEERWPAAAPWPTWTVTTTALGAAVAGGLWARRQLAKPSVQHPEDPVGHGEPWAGFFLALAAAFYGVRFTQEHFGRGAAIALLTVTLLTATYAAYRILRRRRTRPTPADRTS